MRQLAMTEDRPWSVIRVAIEQIDNGFRYWYTNRQTDMRDSLVFLAEGVDLGEGEAQGKRQ